MDVTRTPTPDEFDLALFFISEFANIEDRDPNPVAHMSIQALLQIIAYALERVENEQNKKPE